MLTFVPNSISSNEKSSSPNEKNTSSNEKNLKSLKDILNQDLGKNSIVFSPIFGHLKYLGDTKTRGLKFQCIKSKELVYFREDGTFADGGKLLLFPSEENKDWTCVPIRYPQSKSELIDWLRAHKSITEDEIEEAKKNNLYGFLSFIASHLDKIGGEIDRKDYPNGKVWEIAHREIQESGIIKLEWAVHRKSHHFYHFAFYRKKAAEVFLNLMQSEIKEWERQTYRIEQEYMYNKDADINIAAALKIWGNNFNK